MGSYGALPRSAPGGNRAERGRRGRTGLSASGSSTLDRPDLARTLTNLGLREGRREDLAVAAQKSGWMCTCISLARSPPRCPSNIEAGFTTRPRPRRRPAAETMAKLGECWARDLRERTSCDQACGACRGNRRCTVGDA